MAHPVFIDGQYGTTGLQIQQRLAAHPEVELLSLPEDSKRDAALRREKLNQAEVVFLCLPDDAAREAAALVDNPDTVIIDASSAHRVDPDWVYGVPELPGQRERLRTARRITNPGCYPTGMTLLTRPLIEAGLLPSDYPVAVHAITGYSGGGKAMIADYRDMQRQGGPAGIAARPKNLDMNHKHLPEMQHIPGLKYPPVFVPTVGNFEQGMIVQVPLHERLLGGTAAQLHQCLASSYAGEAFVQLMPLNDHSLLEDGFLDPTACNDTNRVELFVFAGNGLIMLLARLDNLGKGASGEAVQNMNLRLGLDETTGLL